MPKLEEGSMDYSKEFFLQNDGLVYEYQTGHWFTVECSEVKQSPERPGGFKYSLAFFDKDDECLVRYDNSHAVNVYGRPNPVAYDHWHRFSDGTLVPYEFKGTEKLLEDFFKAVEKHLKL